MNEERQQIPYLPVRTVVKFYENHDPKNANKLFTKTLLKVGFIDNNWKDSAPTDTPQDGEFWLVDVIHETCVGQGRGCFLLHPLRKVDDVSLNRLLPGMYKEKDYRGCLLLEPKSGGVNWLVPKRHKQNVPDIYAIIVSQ